MSTVISVVIPVLNDARLLERCLAALAAQTRPPNEVIVVDNGCTDDSVAVAQRYGAQVVTERRPGITAASAHGFDVAAGSIIARCDADSVVPPAWLAQMERKLDAAPDAVAITGPATFYNLGGIRGLLARAFYIHGYFLSMRLMLGHNVLFGSNCAVRADAWQAVSDSVPRDDTEVHDDMDLSYRLPATSRVMFDRALVVGISARPFDSWRVYRRRLVRAGNTFSHHFPAQLPHRRWAARWQRRTRRPIWTPKERETPA